jgi:hypothetical protein
VTGERAARRTFADPAVGGVWRIALPSSVLGATAEVTFLVDEPQSPQALGWSTDDRAIGIHLRTLSVVELGPSMQVGETLVFSDPVQAQRVLGDGWAAPENGGVWTVEENARIALQVSDPGAAGVDVVLDVVPFVTRSHPKLKVEVWVAAHRLATQVFRDGESAEPLRVRLPQAMIDESGRVTLELRLSDPASPRDVGYSEDPRRLGVYLQRLTITEPGARVTAHWGVTTFRKLRRRLWRSARS